MREQQFLPVNWIDGMKINKSHFVSQENAFAFQLMQTASALQLRGFVQRVSIPRTAAPTNPVVHPRGIETLTFRRLLGPVLQLPQCAKFVCTATEIQL